MEDMYLLKYMTWYVYVGTVCRINSTETYSCTMFDLRITINSSTDADAVVACMI